MLVLRSECRKLTRQHFARCWRKRHVGVEVSCKLDAPAALGAIVLVRLFHNAPPPDSLSLLARWIPSVAEVKIRDLDSDFKVTSN
jgi:hypothetical protein